MFFPPNIFQSRVLSAESIRNQLSSPRIEYGEALFEWYNEMIKMKEISYEYGYSIHKEVTLAETTRHHIIEQKIINCLRKEPMNTIEIGKKILGRSTSRRPIISILHKMASEGIIIHHQEGNEHMWELTQSSVITPIVVPT
jgi:predicted transcriptional regulator